LKKKAEKSGFFYKIFGGFFWLAFSAKTIQLFEDASSFCLAINQAQG